MITDIHVHTYRGIDCHLTGLGHINVLCGKNSSGKSTILSAISNADHRVVGMSLRDIDWSDVLAHPSVSPLLTFGKDGIGVEPSLKAVGQERKVWLETDVADFISMVKFHAESQGIQVPDKAATRIFVQMFADNLRHVLIPERRDVESNATPAARANVASDGKGLVTQLFALKNRSKDTDEYQLFVEIQNRFQSIANGTEFDVVFTEGQNKMSILFYTNGGSGIPLSESGLGLQQLLVILYFAMAGLHSIILIEEPESHMHPDMQRKLLAFMKEHSKAQFILTTHSNVFLDERYVDRIFYTYYDGVIHIDDATSKAMMLSDLGYSVVDNLLSDLVILVEGPSDVPVIEHFLAELSLHEKYNIKLWPLGGDIMDQIDLSAFRDTHEMMALVDNDPGSKRVREKFIKKCDELGIPVCRLQGYSIENYFTIEALKNVLDHQFPNHVTAIAPDKKLEEQLGQDVKKKNRRIAQAMSWSDIENTDLGDFIRQVKERLASIRPMPTVNL